MTIVDASPTKRFFVSMLTRDIALIDAILDLLDNCIDGILRKHKGVLNNNRPYEGYWAKIIATPELFSIIDNCGGIPKDIAEKSAFRLGRVDGELDSDLPTVGMYGIGMKRALFKMGKRSVVRSQHNGEAYDVKITPEWLSDDNSWQLQLQSTDDNLLQDGTYIIVTDLYEPIQVEFDLKQSDFLEDLEKEIARLFALIIKKGFTVYLNDMQVKPVSLDILYSSDFTISGIQPYAFRTIYSDVEIDVIVGFYRQLATVEEVDQDTDLPRVEVKAGWTVVCNDRIVVYQDRSIVTGWGLGNVPHYHPQFRTIAGVVQFTSNNSNNLPLRTTKRGIEMQSPTYLLALQYMQEGVKKFTYFTNKWKGREQETFIDFKQTEPQYAIQVVKAIPEERWQKVKRSDVEAKRFIPELPMPPKNDEKIRISFFRLSKEVEILGEFFFDDQNASPSEIGNHCFNDALAKAKAQ
ncbi:MAG: ATP-binding protein [Chloroflexi bacterium]|nr:ATP-binding protein [Chloroflexota bacterium]